MKSTRALGAVLSLSLGASISSYASAVTLTFDGNICNGGNACCKSIHAIGHISAVTDRHNDEGYKQDIYKRGCYIYCFLSKNPRDARIMQFMVFNERNRCGS